MPESARDERKKMITKFETRKSRKEWLLKIAVLTCVYFAAAKLGLMIAFEKTNASPIWPPTGVALAAVLLYGYRIWPGITIGAFLANISTFLANGFSRHGLQQAPSVGRYLSEVDYRSKTFDGSIHIQARPDSERQPDQRRWLRDRVKARYEIEMKC